MSSNCSINKPSADFGQQAQTPLNDSQLLHQAIETTKKIKAQWQQQDAEVEELMENSIPVTRKMYLPNMAINGKHRLSDDNVEPIDTIILPLQQRINPTNRSATANRSTTLTNVITKTSISNISKSIKLPPPLDSSISIVSLPDCPQYSKASIQQKLVLYAVFYGKLNVLITGAGGSGKSFVLNALKQLSGLLGFNIHFTATTGKASTLLPDATTLHTFLGVGLAEGSPTKVAQRMAKKFEVKDRISKCDILVIDEVSMLDARLLECLNQGAQLCRRNKQPFGGMQLILSADFYQLPPVKKNDFNTTNNQNNAYNKYKRYMPVDEEEQEEIAIYKNFDFCFEHPEWSKFMDCVIELTVPFRQNKDDAVFLDLLSHMREGKMKEEHHQLLEKINKQTLIELGNCKSLSSMIPKLFPFNANVDEMNDMELDKLDPTKKMRKNFVFKTKRVDQDDWNRDEFSSWLDYQRKECFAYSTVTLCKNSLVVLVVNTNTEEGFVNGLDGIVTKFDAESGLPVVKFSNGVEKIVERFTWKHTDLRFGDEVASRNTDTGILTGASAESDTLGLSGRVPHVTYEQIPLKLAHAMTITKAQGQSLKRAQIQLFGRLFYGQAYVAVSRLSSLEGLKLTQYERSSVKAHPKATNFYKNLRESNKSLVLELAQLEQSLSNVNNQLIQPTAVEISSNELDTGDSNAFDFVKAGLTKIVQRLSHEKAKKHATVFQRLITEFI